MSCSCCGHYGSKCTGCSCRRQHNASHTCKHLETTEGLDNGRSTLTAGRIVACKDNVEVPEIRGGNEIQPATTWNIPQGLCGILCERIPGDDWGGDVRAVVQFDAMKEAKPVAVHVALDPSHLQASGCCCECCGARGYAKHGCSCCCEYSKRTHDCIRLHNCDKFKEGDRVMISKEMLALCDYGDYSIPVLCGERGRLEARRSGKSWGGNPIAIVRLSRQRQLGGSFGSDSFRHSTIQIDPNLLLPEDHRLAIDFWLLNGSRAFIGDTVTTVAPLKFPWADDILPVGTKAIIEAAGECEAFIRWSEGPFQGCSVELSPTLIGARQGRMKAILVPSVLHGEDDGRFGMSIRPPKRHRMDPVDPSTAASSAYHNIVTAWSAAGC